MTQLTTTPQPALVDTTAVQTYDHIGFLCRIVLRGEDTGGTLSMVEERGRRGAMTPRHIHAREAETFVVLEGAIEGWCEGTLHLVEAGNLVYLPAGREHAFRVASDVARFYTLITPAGFETFFRDTGRELAVGFESDPPVQGAPTPEEVAALQRVLDPLGCTITGPPPFAPAGG